MLNDVYIKHDRVTMFVIVLSRVTISSLLCCVLAASMHAFSCAQWVYLIFLDFLHVIFACDLR